MGLFGAYTKKDFEKRTEIFKEKLEDLCSLICQIEGYKKLLTKLMIELDYSKYPKVRKKDRKQIKEIDDRIDRLITSLKQDAQDENGPRFTRHAEILLHAIKDSRWYGRERYDKRYLENEENLATAVGEIHNIRKAKATIEQEKNKIAEKAKKLSSSDKEELQRLELQYAAVEQEEQALNDKLNTWRSRYNAAIRIESEYNHNCVFPSPMDSVDLKKIFDEIRDEGESMYSSCESSSFNENEPLVEEPKNPTSKDSQQKPDPFPFLEALLNL